MTTQTGIDSVERKVAKAVLAILLVAGVWQAQTLLLSAYLPAATSDVAVQQVESSDDAYAAITSHETLKNLAPVISLLLSALIVAGLFRREIVSLYTSVQNACTTGKDTP